MRTRIARIVICLTLTLAMLGCDRPSPPEKAQARFIRQIEWIGKGQWLKADTHIHTTFSDGAHTVLEVAAQAKSFGCDVIAITDHADQDQQAASEEYIRAIQTARHAYPEMIIFAGLEWNLPPWGKREHATVLITPSFKEGDLLRQFKLRFDDLREGQHDPALADEALRWLAQYGSVDGVDPVVIYNHPSRSQPTTSQAITEPLNRWRNVNDVVIGFSGAPGHQLADSIGRYLQTETPIDRWDPAVGRVGDAWDTLLASGVDLWAARAPSDFHFTGWDAWPGQFSETWLYAPDRSPQGVLRALRAGSFFADHGHIVREVVFTVDAAGLARPAWPGEVIEVPPQATITVRMDMQIPEHDWQGRPNRINALELIMIDSAGEAKIIANEPPNPENPVLTQTFDVLPGGMVLRARGRRVVEAGPDLMFYTNPIRVRTGDSLKKENKSAQ